MIKGWMNWFTILFLSVNFALTSYGQRNNDMHWILSNFIHLNFDSNVLTTEIIDHPSLGLVTGPFHTAISSDSGDLFFHTAGCFVFDQSCNIMANGDSLNPDITDFGFCQHGGAPWYQNVLILPYPELDSVYILFTLDVADPFPVNDTMHGVVPLHVYYHLIDMHADAGNGAVTTKNHVAITDTLAGGYLQACQHANGRDWWVLIPEWNSNCYRILSVDPEGIGEAGRYCGGTIQGTVDYGASFKISPDGKWCARSFPWLNDSLGHVDLFSFDRCAGELTYLETLTFPVSFANFTGVSFSPNSEYLYASTFKSLWQFNVNVPDVQSTLMLAGTIENEFTSEKGSLYYQQLGPDGRIYISSPGGHKYLSVINLPDQPGLMCQFGEHVLKMPANRSNFVGLPNYPNYRLGPEDNSGCDTIGLNNIPVAHFRFEITESLNVDFVNLSYFEPTFFVWDFGDGNTTEHKNADHQFEKNGSYTVCLTAGNDYGSDTYCQAINLHSTDLQDETVSFSGQVYPNPFLDELMLTGNFSDVRMKLFDQLGQLLARGQNKIANLSALVPGTYYVQITSANHHFVTRVIKAH